jgi:hypothetical protein
MYGIPQEVAGEAAWPGAVAYAQTQVTSSAGVQVLNAKQLNKFITTCRSWQKLQRLVREHGAGMNAVHTCAAWSAAARLLGGCSTGKGAAVPPALRKYANASEVPLLAELLGDLQVRGAQAKT